MYQWTAASGGLQLLQLTDSTAVSVYKHTRGVEYVVKTSHYIPKFILIYFIITFIKRYVSWLNKCKTAVVQLLI